MNKAEAIQDPIKRALYYATRNGGENVGEHHKAWTIDQMVRALLNCPFVEWTGRDDDGKTYAHRMQGDSDAYRAWVAEYEAGEDGPKTYEWYVGIPG